MIRVICIFILLCSDPMPDIAACIRLFSSSSSAISVMSEKSTASEAFVSKSEKRFDKTLITASDKRGYPHILLTSQ